MTTETIALAYGHRAKTTETALKLALERGEIGYAQDTDSIWIKRYDDTYKKITASSLLDLSSVSASQVLATDASKNLISLATVGSGRVVLETSPVLTTPNIGVASGASLALSTRLVVNLLAGNQIALNSAGSNIGFVSNLSADTWALGYGTTLGTLGTSALSWNASGLISTPGLLSTKGGIDLDSIAEASRTITFKKSGLSRWSIRANGNAESGSNAGTIFEILAFDDSGTQIDSPFSIDRSTAGNIRLNRTVTLLASYDAYCVLYTNGGNNIASTSNLTFNGTDLVLTGTFSVSGIASHGSAIAFTAAGTAANWSLWRSATNGLSIQGGTGSSYDFTLFNPAGQSLFRNPTGTNTLDFPNTSSFSGSAQFPGSASFTNAPVFSSVTASQILGVNSSKALISFATTGTGSVVLSASPTLTGTIVGVNQTLSGTLGVTGTLTAGVISATGDITVSRSNVGGNDLIEIENTDDSNAASGAKFFAKVGGSSAGDPAVMFQISGGVSVILGVDNSVSGDPFKISYSSSMGTNDALTIDSSLLATFGGSVSLDGGGFLRFPRATSHPIPTGQGCFYENIVDGHLYRYTGSAWAALA